MAGGYRAILGARYATAERPYPHLIKPPTTGELLIAFGKEDKPKELKEAIERAQQQELERLLYVATTRARHTLVIVLDQEIFSNSEGRLPKTAQLRRLLCGQDAYRGEFDEDTTLPGASLTSQTSLASAEKPRTRNDNLETLDIKRALKRGSEFVRKLRPSALDAEISDTVLQPRSRPDNLATLYGRWWHKFFERLDWKAGLDSAQKLFGEHLPSSPDPKSAAKDWSTTRDNLFGNKTIANFLGGDKHSFIASCRSPGGEIVGVCWKV